MPDTRIHLVPIDKIIQGPQQVRHDPYDDSIGELALSIQTKGLLQPAGVRPNNNGTFQLLWGGRRMAAHIRLKAKTLPAVYRDTPNDEIKTIALIENIERKQLTLAEEVDVVIHLNEQENLSPAAISDRLCRSREWVLRRLRFPSLPEELREYVFDGDLSLGAAEEISALDDESKRRFLAQQVIVTKAKIADVRRMVSALKEVENIEERIQPAITAAVAAVAEQPLKVDCGICGRPNTMEDTMMVYVCRSGCPDPDQLQEEQNDANNGRTDESSSSSLTIAKP